MANKINTPTAPAYATGIIKYEGRELVIPYDRFDYTRVTDEQVEQQCADKRTNRIACQLRTGKHSIIEQLDDAVYVMSPSSRSASKVGFTTNPVKRVEAIQCGNHEQINITHLFWLPRKAAQGLEMLALRTFAKLGMRLKGEWVACGPDQAGLIISVLATTAGLPVASSAMFARNAGDALRTFGVLDDSWGVDGGSPEQVAIARQNCILSY